MSSRRCGTTSSSGGVALIHSTPTDPETSTARSSTRLSTLSDTNCELLHHSDSADCNPHLFKSRSIDFCRLIVRVFDKSSVNSIDFDDFIQVCVSLHTLTDKFRAKDTNQSGFVQLHYEQVRCELSFPTCRYLEISSSFLVSGDGLGQLFERGLNSWICYIAFILVLPCSILTRNYF